MTKSLRSLSKKELLETIKRRLAEKKMGLGYWAAVDAQKKLS